MQFREPNHTRGDVHFQIGPIPVRVHPFFWLMALLTGLRLEMRYIPLWIGVVFVSILVHELGHACMARAWGWSAKILLWQLGGLAIHEHGDDDPKKQIGVLLAGPGAGFVLGGVVIALLFLTGHWVGYGFGSEKDPLNLFVGRGVPIANDNLRQLARQLVFVNMFWGLVNLVPIYPLDGGQIARELFGMRDGNMFAVMRKTLVLSLTACVVVGVLAWQLLQEAFPLFFFGFLAFNSYIMLQQFRGGGGGFGGGFGSGYGGYNDEHDDYGGGGGGWR